MLPTTTQPSHTRRGLLALAMASAALGAPAPANAQATGSLSLSAATAMRLRPEADRIGLQPGDPVEVAAVAALVCDIHVARSPCGGYCHSTRADRTHIPDYSAEVIDEVDCWDTARVFVAGSQELQVPLDEVLATAFHESTFREHAIGAATECGMFQQSTRWIRWSSPELGIARVPFASGEDTCAYLLRMENAMFHFAIKYHHERAQSGAEWSAHYNGGPNMWSYMRRHEALRGRFGRYVEVFIAEHGATLGPIAAAPSR